MITCNGCGRQLPDGSRFCKFCGASQNAVVQKAVPVTNMRTMPEFVQEGKPSAKKNKKPIKTAVLIIVAVLLVIAIVATCIVIKNMPKTDEEKLRKILEESTTKPVIEMVCKDYDSDGEYEAYAIVSEEGEEGDKEFGDADIYFVNQKKAQKIKENVTGESNGVIVTDERIYISIEEEISDDESYSLVYTANGEEPAESEISGMYSDVHQEGGKVIATDDTGEEIVLDMPDGIRDIKSGRKNKKKPEKPTEPDLGEIPEEEPVVDNYESDIETYNDYFSSSEWTTLLEEHYMEDNGYIEVNSCVVDLNGDKSYELLVSVMDKEFTGVRGYSTVYFLFAVQNDSVVILQESANGGGSGGGDDICLRYDTVEQKPVAIYYAYGRDGIWLGIIEESFYNYNGTSLVTDFVMRYEYYLGDSHYDEEIETIKSETDLYEDLDGGAIACYKIDGDYVSKEEYYAISERYSTENPQYQMQMGTYYDPISYLN